MMKPMSQGGVSNLPIEALMHRNVRLSNVKRPTPYQEYALGTLVTDVVGAMRVNEVLFDQRQLFHRDDVARIIAAARAAAVGAAAGNAAAVGAAVDNAVGGAGAPVPQGFASRRSRVVDLLTDIGLFNDQERLSPTVQAIIDVLYVGFAANGSTSIRETGNLRRNFPRAYSQDGSMLNNKSVTVRYVKIIHSYANLRQGVYDRAVAHKTRRIVGTALSPSTKGQRLDILLGHFRN